MQDLPLEVQADIKSLQSEDSSVRREVAEKYLSAEMYDEIVEALAEKLVDPDIGVRDAVCQALIYNDNKSIPGLVVKYTTSKQEISTRNLAGEILLKRGISSLEAMTNFIDVGDDDDKKFIIDLMGLIGDVSPAPKVIEVLNENKNDNVILACIECLGNIESKESVQHIAKKYEESELFKPTIIEAIGNIGTEEGSNFIVEKYAQEDNLTRFSMIESLGKIGNEQAFFLLLSELPNMSGPLTWASVRSLKVLKEKLGLDVPFDEHIKNALLSTLVEGEISHKRAAASLISVFEDKDIIVACLKIFGTDEEIDQDIKSEFFKNSLFLYPKLTDYLKEAPKNLNALLELLKEMIMNDGGESVQQVSEIDLRNLCDVLTTNLDHDHEEIRRSAIELLFFLSLDTALMFVDTMIDDDNYWNRIRLVEIFENLDDERAKEGLKKLAEDEEEMVRERAQEILDQRQ